MSFLDESTYLADQAMGEMVLPQELMQQLGADVTVATTAPEGWVALPGGIIIKKQTLIIVGVALVLLLVWWKTRKPKRR